jgi:hypothetical protein
VQRIICGLKKKQWEKGRNYVRRVTKYTEIKARFPLNFGRYTHDDKMKKRALRNIHPGSCHCKNTILLICDVCSMGDIYRRFEMSILPPPPRQKMAVTGSSKSRYISI